MARNHIRIQIVYDTDPCYLSWLLPTWLLPGTRMEFELHSPSRRGELSNGLGRERLHAIGHTRYWKIPLVKLMEQAIIPCLLPFLVLFFFSFFSFFPSPFFSRDIVKFNRFSRNAVSSNAKQLCLWRNIANNIVNELVIFCSIIVYQTCVRIGYYVRN